MCFSCEIHIAEGYYISWHLRERIYMTIYKANQVRIILEMIEEIDLG